MNKPAKLPEIRKEAFTQARENLGLTVKELAAKSCFSVHQIEQLENGESSSFYGPQVKVTAAKKVAGLLNLSEEEAFDFGGVVTPVKVTQDDTKSANKTASDNSSKQLQASESKKEQGAEKPPSALLKAHSTKAESKPSKRFFILLGIAAALVFSIVNLRPLFFPEPPKEEVLVVEQVVQEPTTPTNPPVEDGKSTSTPTQSSAAVDAVPPAAATAAASNECPTADTAITYKADAPKKAGDVVYLQAKTAQTVCVIDASGKTQNKTLEPGVGVSIYGKPPFKVLTAGLNQVDLYFQGAKVRTTGSGKTIILEAADISQPAVSTDSQMR